MWCTCLLHCAFPFQRFDNHCRYHHLRFFSLCTIFCFFEPPSCKLKTFTSKVSSTVAPENIECHRIDLFDRFFCPILGKQNTLMPALHTTKTLPRVDNYRCDFSLPHELTIHDNPNKKAAKKRLFVLLAKIS